MFCLATYGEGDPTDNCMEFYDWIQNNDVDFSGLNYAVSVVWFCACNIFLESAVSDLKSIPSGVTSVFEDYFEDSL